MAAGHMLSKGFRVVDPPWPNTKALVETGYLVPTPPVKPEAKADSRKPAAKKLASPTAGQDQTEA